MSAPLLPEIPREISVVQAPQAEPAPEPVPEPTLGVVKRPSQHFYWLWIMCLLGLDYFSTLAYQPSITFEAAGRLGPLATAVVVLVTLLGALPIYWYLAGRSPSGQGSLGMLERLVRGWRGKTLVLILLGFAATDFTLLKSLSLADASVHLLNHHDSARHAWLHENVATARANLGLWFGPEAAGYVDEQIAVTLFLGCLGFVFWFVLRRGFNRNVLMLAVPLITAYLLLSGLVLGAGLWYLVDHPAVIETWLTQVQDGDWLTRTPRWVGDDWGDIALVSFLFLPNLALGLSGFELNMILMPQVLGKRGEPEGQPTGRIRNTRKVLVAAAVIMSVYLLASVVVTTLLIPPAQLGPQGLANNRALAYLAHGGTLLTGDEPLLPLCGPWFGMVYDAVTVLVLCLAGTSVMTGLAALLPHFLSRFGMEFRWVRRWGVMLALFAALSLVVTVWFKASVADQRGAYATGVLVMLAAAALVTVIDKRQHARRVGKTGWRHALLYPLDQCYYVLFTLIFSATMVAVALRTGSGLLIAAGFVVAILGMSILSRGLRANEARTVGFDFKDDSSKLLWDALRLADFPILVPVRPGREVIETKEREIRRNHNLSPDADIVFLEVGVDDPSNFYQRPLLEVSPEDNRFVIKATRCVSVSHTIVSVALALSESAVPPALPPALHFGWPETDMLTASWYYLAFGEGNIAWKARELIARLEKDAKKRPRVVVG